MTSTFVNNLALNEMATGDQSGSWGTVTNLNLEMIGQALGHGTRVIANASSDNITMGSGVLDDDRALYLKLTGGGQACTVTLLPATMSKVWIMENGTAAALTFTQGSGANVVIPAGETKVIACTGGAGTAQIVYDVFTDLNLAGTTVVDDLTVSDTALVTGVLTTTAATVFNGGFAANADSTMGTNKKLGFRDAAIFINSSADGQLDIVADTEIQIAATTIDINGAVALNGAITGATNITLSGKLDAATLDTSGAAVIDGTLAVGAALSSGYNASITGGVPLNTVATSTVSSIAYGGLGVTRQHTGVGQGTGIGFQMNSADGTNREYAYIGTIIESNADGGGQDGSIGLFPVLNNGRVQRFTVKSNGNVGIGTSTPGRLVEINNATNPALRLNNGNSNADIGIASSAGAILTGAADDDLVIARNGAFGISLGTNGTARLNIAADGAISTPTAGANNVRLGVNAGDALASGGDQNVVVGDEAGTAMNTGSQNSAFGYKALAAVTGADDNSAFGWEALKTNTSGTLNSAFGRSALTLNEGGSSNSAFGYAALSNNSSGTFNTAMGRQAGLSVGTGAENTLIGGFAGDATDDGLRNVAVGYLSLSANCGDNNTAVGTQALQAYTGSDSTAVGYAALNVATGTLNTAVGKFAGLAIEGGTHNTMIGALAGDATDDGVRNVALGYLALSANCGDNNTALGTQSLQVCTTSDNTAIGYAALNSATSGSNNCAGGRSALLHTIGGSNNTAFGTDSGSFGTTANNSTFIGHQAGLGITGAKLTGNANTAVGKDAGKVLQGAATLNTLVGGTSGSAITTGANNICIGFQAGSEGVNLTTGAKNILIGNFSNTSAVDVEQEIVIGYDIGGGGTNTVRIGTPGGSATLGLDGSDTSWAAASDERLKKDVATSTAGLSFIKDLRPITYKWKAKDAVANTLPQYDEDSTDPVYGSGRTQHGFIAQEVKAAINSHSEIKNGFSMWVEDPNGTQQVAPAALVPILVKAIQELSAKNDALASRITVLEG